MKKSISVAALCILLASCGGSGDEHGSAACENDYISDLYTTCLPENWFVIATETLRQRGVPEETVVAFQSETAVSGQFPTVAVTREALRNVVTPESYSEGAMRSVATLPGYVDLDARTINIDGEKLKLHVFNAQPVPSDPLRRFLQVSTVADRVGYTITGTLPVSVDQKIEDQVLLVIRQSSFVIEQEEDGE